MSESAKKIAHFNAHVRKSKSALGASPPSPPSLATKKRRSSSSSPSSSGDPGFNKNWKPRRRTFKKGGGRKSKTRRK